MTEVGRLLLFVGRIEPYKGVSSLITAVRQTDDKDLNLLIAGSVSSVLEAELRQKAGQDDRIAFDFRFVPDDELGLIVGAADLVVLPFERILNSSTALMVLGLGGRILVPHIGSLAELSARMAPGWVLTYNPPLTPAAVKSALARAEPVGLPDLSEFSWTTIGQSTARFYRALLAEKANG